MKKHTKGTCIVTESGNPHFDLCVVSEEDGGSICHITNWSEAEGDAELIRDAFNVTNDTGLSPLELQDQNDILVETTGELVNEKDELHKQNEKMRKALEEIRKGEGPYHLDPSEHANNTIENMKSIATEALESLTPSNGQN